MTDHYLLDDGTLRVSTEDEVRVQQQWSDALNGGAGRIAGDDAAEFEDQDYTELHVLDPLTDAELEEAAAVVEHEERAYQEIADMEQAERTTGYADASAEGEPMGCGAEGCEDGYTADGPCARCEGMGADFNVDPPDQEPGPADWELDEPDIQTEGRYRELERGWAEDEAARAREGLDDRDR